MWTLFWLGLIVITLLVYKIWQLNQSKLTSIDKKLKEISGIEFDKRNRLWAVNDGGDDPTLYLINDKGEITREITIENAKNVDWEDMTQDYFGHFFIGDFGNNDKERKWLTIYKIENPIDIKTETTQAEIIKFTYPEFEKTEATGNHNYDIEAFIYYHKKLYLFTKNKASPFNGETKLYKIGDHAANFKAKHIASFTPCKTLKELCWITSAALSPDKSKLALLGSDRVWIFENWQADDFFSGDKYEISLGAVTQKEAITFLDDNTLVFTDEKFAGFGGNLYKIQLDRATKVKRITANKAANKASDKAVDKAANKAADKTAH